MKTLLFAIMALTALACCQGGQKAPDYEAKRDSLLADSRRPKTERMSDYNYTDRLDWSGADSYSIVRRAADSLGTVRDEDGTQYVNNTLRLTLTRGDRSVFDKTFTKGDFASMDDSRFFRRSVLEGMAFDRITPEGARFVVSIGLPLSDEFVQFAVTVSASGSTTIEPTEIIDDTLEDDSI